MLQRVLTSRGDIIIIGAGQYIRPPGVGLTWTQLLSAVTAFDLVEVHLEGRRDLDRIRWIITELPCHGNRSSVKRHRRAIWRYFKELLRDRGTPAHFLALEVWELKHGIETENNS